MTFVVILSLPILLLITYFASKGLPEQPVMIGLIAGLGCGLAGEAAWRLHCQFTAFDHILGSHTPGVIFAALLGAGIGYLYRRYRSIKQD